MTMSQGKKQAVGGNPIECANYSVPKSRQRLFFLCSAPAGPMTAGQWDTPLCVPVARAAWWYELEEAFYFSLGGGRTLR